MSFSRTIRIKTFLVLGLLCYLPAWNRVAAQNAVAISSSGSSPYIALDWAAYPHASAYNIYRKAASASAYPATPLNASPIRPVTSCPQIRSLLIQGTDSTNWNLVARGLGDSLLFNPCNVNNPGLNAAKAARLGLLAKSVMPIALVVGTGFEDHTVTASDAYTYEIVALNTQGQAIGTVGDNLSVTAGQINPFPAPTGIIAEAGDAKNQVMWAAVTGAAGYEIDRSTAPGGPFTRVNASTYSTTYTHHLNGDTLIPGSQGYVDFQVYDTAGKPTTHRVGAVNISGPDNGTTYYYRVRALDFFNRPGTPSAVSGPTTPKDTTPPAVAGNLLTTVDNIHGYVKVSWTQVVKDVKGRWEEPDSTVSYQLYRFTTSSNPNAQTPVLVAKVKALPGKQTVDTVDKYSGLRAQYGNKTWWYRLRCVDAVGNTSAWSAAISAIVEDTTPPRIVTGVSGLGFPDHISLNWQLNTEPDMGAYMVYRSLCHLGAWVNCTNLDTCATWYDNYNPNGGLTGPPTVDRRKSYPCPCSGSFVFLGTITQDSAKRAKAAGNFMFSDHTIPAGSPLCYAYWIKAKDSSGNLSGAFPIPTPQEQAQIICVHLKDTTPPQPAVISSLNAIDGGIIVQWIGPPSQDIRAYHVYRAVGTMPGQEPLATAFTWAGGMTVELPPKTPQVLTAPYVPPHVLPCDSIPVQAMPWMSVGLFVDTHVAPKLTYWYKVVGIDYEGNQTPLSKAASVSTFTFALAPSAPPRLDTLEVVGQPCTVQISWSPAVDTAKQVGVIVYRSMTAAGPFNPIVTAPVKGSTFVDTHVMQGQTYYYEIAAMAKTGQITLLTPYKSITP